MKKLLSLMLLLALSLTLLVSCNDGNSTDGNKNDEETLIRIGYMQGPTGMGMAKLIHDNGGIEGNKKYQFTKFEDANKATTALLTGAIDMACLPTNNAATIYNKNEKAATVLAINCLNSLFVMTKTGTSITTFEDLEGKTIYTISNGTPKVILKYALDAMGINATISTEATINGNEKTLAQPSDLTSAMIAGAIDIALVPEPVATAAPLQIASQGKDYTYSVALDFGNVWNEVADGPLAMGCIVGRTEFVNENKEAVNSFLAEYQASVAFISSAENRDDAAQYIVDAAVLGAVPPAKKSLANLGTSIAYKDGDEMETILKEFYITIDENLIGGKLPDDDFYYKK